VNVQKSDIIKTINETSTLVRKISDTTQPLCHRCSSMNLKCNKEQFRILSKKQNWHVKEMQLHNLAIQIFVMYEILGFCRVDVQDSVT
jgi:hypothetical protein